MENSANFIRVRVDVRDVGLPFVRQAWVSVNRSYQRTIKDFKLSLYAKFKFPEDQNISLYLQGCLLPDDETIFLLRDDDLIRVVCENLPSVLDSQYNDFVCYASSNRNSARHITDVSCDVSFPAAKKIRIHSPVHITETLHDTPDRQNSRDGECLGDVPTKIATDVNNSKRELLKKKLRKHKKHLKEKNKSIGITGSLDIEVDNSSSEKQEVSVPPKNKADNLVLPRKRTEDYEDAYEVTNPKGPKVKKVNETSKTALKSLEQISETSPVCENNTDCTDSEKSAEVVFSNVKLKHVDGPTYEERDYEYGLNYRKTTSSCEVSQNVLSPLLCSEEGDSLVASVCDKPLQVEGDCTQSLGNNCPKKKRRRRRKRKSESISVPSDPLTSFPTPPCYIGESVSGFVQSIRDEHNGRKHIRFSDSPESNQVATVLDSNCSENTAEKPSSAVVESSQLSEESFNPKLSSSVGEEHGTERIIPETLFNQEEPAFFTDGNGSSADKTGKKADVQEINESMLVEEKKKSYDSFPPLSRFPAVGEIIAFKMLELTDSYCPEVSDYKEGKVISVNSSTDDLEIDLVEEQVIVRTGKFENLYPDEAVQPQVIKKVFMQWPALIEPKLVS